MNLPNTTSNRDCLAFESGSDGGIYIGTEVGIYFTNNKRIAAFNPLDMEEADDLENTSGWVRLGAQLPHAPSTGVEINYKINRMRASTYGRGVWEHDLQCPPQPDITATGTHANDVFEEALHNIISNAIIPNARNVNYRGGNSIHLSPGFHANSGSRFHGFIHPCNMPGNSFNPKSLATSNGNSLSEQDQADLEKGLKIYPNPANETLSILCASCSSESQATIRFFDTTGKLVLIGQVLGSLEIFDVAALTGLFTVVVDNDSSRFVERIVIE